MKIKSVRSKIGLLLLVVFLLLFGRPLIFLTYHSFKDKRIKSQSKPGYVNDASRMNETKVDSIIEIDSIPAKAENQLIQLIQNAIVEGKKISIAGSQHSMGGHTIYPGGIVLNMKGFNQMHLDTVSNIFTVGSGATWAEAIPFLDKYNRSVGGYGLFGIILEIKLKVVRNGSYRMYQYVLSSENYIQKFDELVNKSTNVQMAYGRLSIDPGNFLNEAIIAICTIDSTEPVPSLKATGFNGLRRTVFRSSVNSKYGKKLRWRIEKITGRLSKGKLFSRNQLINDPVDIYQNRQQGYTDILHEYFIPRDSVTRFINQLKKIIPQHKVDLLNITIRNVMKDQDVFLRYASSEVFGFVMLYNQATTQEAENEMRRCTQKLIDIAIALKGTYYLPYRLHASKEQLSKAYPMAEEFFRLKKKYDPQEIFQNEFYKTYK